MRIALLGGNGYSYANAPSYVHANGRGYIRQDDLLGATAREIAYTPELAYQTQKDLEAQGQPVPANIRAMADQYKVDRRYELAERGTGLLEKGFEFITNLTDGKKSTPGDPNAASASDNTALIIIGGVGAVAVLGVLLSTKKKTRRR